MIVNIVGGGDSKALVTPGNFTIGTNFHCEWANIIFAVDDYMVKDLLKENYLVFTTPKTYVQFRHDSRYFLFNSKQFYNTHSLSSGLNAICLANLLGFSTINLFGFDKIQTKFKENYDKFLMIKETEKEYVFK